MKKLFFLSPIILLLACHTTSKINQEATHDDSSVLRPPEGYSNPRFARSANYVDSFNHAVGLQAKPVPCIQVQNLMATSIAATSVSLFWTSTGANKYTIYQNTIDAKGGQNIGQSTTNKFIVQNLSPGTIYYFSVAMNGQGNKVCDISDPITVSTTGPQPPPPPVSGSDQVVFIQFNADTVSNTSWNVSGPIISPGSGLTSDEQQAILNFAISNYTGHPKIKWTLDRSVFDQADPTHRQKTICTTYSSWYGMAGGVSYIGSFNTNTPNWVFTELLNYNVRNIGDALIHEVGHALGCRHAVDSCGQSYAGVSSVCIDGIIRTKIMGRGYSDYQHFFQRPIYTTTWGIPILEASSCIHPDEDQTIESHLK